MDLIRKYMTKHQNYMIQVFRTMGKLDKIQATKVFNYFQNSFNQEQFRFELNGRNFLEDDENSTQMQKLLESYYRITQGDESKKFYLYRIQYSFQEIAEIIEFWLQRQPRINIVYIQEGGPQIARGTAQINKNQNHQQNTQKVNVLDKLQNDSLLNEQNNQFDIDEDKLPALIEQQQLKVKQLQKKLKQTNIPQQQNQLIKKIQEIKMKIKVLQQHLKTKSPGKQKKNNRIKGRANSIQQSTKTVDSPKSINTKITINYKAIFDFYAKQNHLTGVKATFQRIQHQSQSINYQKLVHFLREFGFLPTSVSDRKKVHGFYIKSCQAKRTLNFQGFMNVLDSVVDLLYPGKMKQQRVQILKQKIYEKDTKNNKILHHPFHSLEKQDFRINVNELNYSFKLKAQDGKFVHQVNDSIQKRKKEKQEEKQDRLKKKQQKQIRYLKKLKSIDPFSPLLIKNKDLLEPKTQQCEPIANLENIEKYRDKSFNFEDQFGIDLKTQLLNSNQMPERRLSGLKRQSSERYKKGQETQRKIDKLQKYQVQKMTNLMSGIIQRNNAKMQKLGISPNKLEKSVRFS